MERKNVLKASVFAGVLIGVSVLGVFTYGLLTMPKETDESEWNVVDHIVMKEGKLVRHGDYDPTGGAGGNASGWLNMFLLDYAQVPPTTEFLDNSTDWNASANAMGYAEIDNWNIDIVSEDPFRFCVKAQFNETHIKSGGVWNHSRARVTLTVSGDETISAVAEFNNSGTDGDANMTANNSDLCYIIFFWDDGSDGYRITDDGTLTVSEIKIEAKY